MRLTGCAALFLSSMLLASTVSAGYCKKPGGHCQETRVRKEWRDLTRNEQLKYVEAVKKTQQGSLTKPSTYDLLAKMHGDNAAPLHTHAIFLPWHRWFILMFEDALREKVPGVTLPYWDWAHDSQEPQAAPFWGDHEWQFGKNGDPDNDNCVTSGAFKNWKPSYPQKHCLKRVWRHQVRNMDGDESMVPNTISAFVSSENMNALLVKSTKFRDAATAIELAPHGTVHNNIGGDMLSMYSPNDPVFYLHHTNIDRLWDAWQKLDGSKRCDDYSGKVFRSSQGASLSNDLHRTAEFKTLMVTRKHNFGDKMTVRDVMDSNNIQHRANGKKKTICVIYEARKPKPLPSTAKPPPRHPRRPPPQDDEATQEEEPPRRPPPRRRPPPPEEEEEGGGGGEEAAEEEEVSERRLVAALKKRLALTLVRRDDKETKPKEEGGKTPAKANGLFTPEGLSPAWLAMNNIKESEALKMQVVIKETTDKLNKVYSECGFIPPDSEIGNRDTCIRELTKKTNPRTTFLVKLHGKEVTLKVTETVKDEKDAKAVYERFIKELSAQGLYITLSEECGKKVAAITGNPVPGVANKKIADVTKKVEVTLQPLNTQLTKITQEAVKEAKQETKKANDNSPSGALTVGGAAGKDGTGKAQAAAEKVVQKDGPAAVAKQNEANKEEGKKEEDAKKR